MRNLLFGIALTLSLLNGTDTPLQVFDCEKAP